MANQITLRELIIAELDRKYNSASLAMLRQIAAISRGNGSQMQVALRELEVEVERLQEAGLPLKPDNAALLKVLSVNRDQLKTTENLIIANSPDIEQSGQSIAPSATAAKVFIVIASLLLAQGKNPLTSVPAFKETMESSGVSWVFPSVADYARGYTQTTAWQTRMNGWGDGYADIIDQTVSTGLQKGWSPIRTAREIRSLAEGLPVNASENITRTLQLQSYRDASLATEMMNGRYIEKKIRVATLDERTCCACLALHGKEVPLGDPIEDHYRGRCDSILIPIGGSMPEVMQADSTPGNRNFVKFQTGEEWFASQSPERQAAQASFAKSPAKLRAYQDGTPLSAFVGHHEDDIFGNMVVENSLKGMLGDDAAQYYVRNESK
jgi:hypothetical protein